MPTGVEFNYQNIIDADGIAIAVTGMLIVFTTLALISGFIAMLPKALNRVSSLLSLEDHGPPASSAEDFTEAEKDEILAAIGFVLYAESKS